jgi:bacterioferritin-associated ferredoxin
LKSILKIGYLGLPVADHLCDHLIMIVCLCREVSDREITAAVRAGATTLDDVARACAGAGTDCGSCRSLIQRQLRCDARRDRADAAA